MEHNRVIYERPYDAEVEYLESTASASTYIDTGLKQSDIVSIETQFADISGYGATYRYSIGSGTGSNNSNILGFMSYNGNLTVNLKGSTITVSSGSLNTFKTVSVNFVTGAVKINSAERELTPCELTDDIFYLFKIPTVSGQRYGFQPIMLKYFKAFSANNTLIRDMIPVRVGQIGYMYDRVSGKLFGNKGTGNFILGQDIANPVPNIRRVFRFGNKRFVIPMPYVLKEEVDYQRYDWLKTNIPKTNAMNLPINSKNFEFKRNFIQVENSGVFSTSDSNGIYSYFTTSDRKVNIWSGNAQKTIYSSKGMGSGILTIIANNNGVTISSATNTDSPPFYGNPIAISFNNVNTVNNSIQLTSSIKVDGVIQYIPCQLLRSIPTYLDANGISRQAGECGMIDLISGKFFGNVANTGTFTVENDN